MVHRKSETRTNNTRHEAIKKMEEYEKYYPKIIKIGNSLGITIPDNLIKGNDWKESDEMIVMIRKKE